MLKYCSNFLFIFAVIAPLFFSCQNKVKTEYSTGLSTPVSVYDSTRAKEIEAIVNEINVGVSQQGPPYRMPFPVYNAGDTLDYWIVNNEPARISVNLIYADKVIWPTFFVKDKELILVRYREWVQVYPSYARERMVYLDNGKIVYCEERSMDLTPGDIPAYLRDKPFSLCSKTEPAIKEDYEGYWKSIQDFLAQNQN